jgi:hypothetical protein
MTAIGSPHLTAGAAPDLESCIKRTEAGQAAWAGWNAPPGATCVKCRHFEPGRRKSQLHELEGRCGKYRALMHRDGARFPAQSRAYRYFDEILAADQGRTSGV